MVVVVVVVVLRPVNEDSYIRANPTSVSVPSGQRVICTAKAPGYKTLVVILPKVQIAGLHR